MSTIAAIATPNAAGGIGIIRISGDEALTITEKCFKSYSGKKITDMEGYRAAYGQVYENDSPIDEAVVIVYRAPKSYTGENVCEICCHGGIYIMNKVLRLIFSLGAIPSEPGEFTKRAYLNGKMDLAQAESVMNVISASGEAALNAARNTLKGSVSKKIGEICSSLISSAAALAAWSDYPDEDIPAVENGALLTTLHSAGKELQKLLDRYDSGKAVTQGVNTVICGKPNVGKSTLMNVLSGCERSIVTSVAGTTRDIIEETVRVGDILLRLADTAGIHETSDEVESIGVNLAKDRMETADLILAVFDVSRPLDSEDRELLEICSKKRCLAIINKSDLSPEFSATDIEKYIPRCITLSAKNEESTDVIKTELENILGTAGLDFSQEMLAAGRQYECAKKAKDCINEAVTALEAGYTVDAVNVSIDCAIEHLLTLTGKKASEEIVNEVFSKFCVGK
ncbi:MAG: tRNA uridine-5-carboxymethylaminomethyl(34) synthesis GTPase MnmE [Ruminococcaceae bacterium]|nr:tRNA uridine-5-carboxymethylaminomethyl(34) synthesis GTPase MnmE [Oscillospiraceae bacterium]